MATSITVDVSYSQLAIFDSALQHPFNDWSDRHVAQGFAWRPGSVSFRTLNDTGKHSVEIDIVDHVGAVSADAVRVIDVPFQVPTNGAIEVGSISDSVPLSLPHGAFLLRCEFLKSGDKVHLVFARSDPPHFAIVCADDALVIDGELLTSAEPALG